MTVQAPRCGFIGLGDLGRPMAERLVIGGLPLTVWARRPESTQGLGEVYVAATARELATRCSVIGICVTGDDDVREVVFGDDGVLAGLQPGSVICVHSTVDPATVAEVDRAARERGAAAVDAPVSGGRRRAEAGALTVTVGGDQAAFDQALPLLVAVGNTVRRVGSLGAGLRVKALNNVLMVANMALAYEALDVGEELGIPGDVLREVLPTMSGSSRGLERAIHFAERDPVHVRAVLLKDTDIYRRLLAAAELSSPLLTEAAAEALGRMRAHPPRDDVAH